MVPSLPWLHAWILLDSRHSAGICWLDKKMGGCVMDRHGKNDYFSFVYKNLKGQRFNNFAQDYPINRKQNHSWNPGQCESKRHGILMALCCVCTVIAVTKIAT